MVHPYQTPNLRQPGQIVVYGIRLKERLFAEDSGGHDALANPETVSK